MLVKLGSVVANLVFTANSVRIETAYGVNGLHFPCAQRDVTMEVFFSFQCSIFCVHFFFVRNFATAQKQLTLKIKNLLPPPPANLQVFCFQRLTVENQWTQIEKRNTRIQIWHSVMDSCFATSPITGQIGELILLYTVLHGFQIASFCGTVDSYSF